MLHHFDAVILGRSLGSLVTAALLSRRDFRVLVLGQGQMPPSYRYRELRFFRRAFSPVFVGTEVWGRVLQDLAQTQSFERSIEPLDPGFALLMPRQRLHMYRDRARLAREVGREFPEVQPVVDDLLHRSGRSSRALSPLLTAGLFPRLGLWERTARLASLRARRARAQLSWMGLRVRDIVEDFPAEHPFRLGPLCAASFETHWAEPLPELSALGASRLLDHWLKGATAISGGVEGFERFLFERIEAHGGTCLLRESACGLIQRRGHVVGVVTADDQTIGAECVVADTTRAELARLFEDPGEPEGAALEPAAGRFVLSCVVQAEALPVPLPRHSFWLTSAKAGVTGGPGVLHVQVDRAADVRHRLLTVEALVPGGPAAHVAGLRETLIDCLQEHLPFVRRHIVACDSVHDGQPLQLWEGGRGYPVDRMHVSEAKRGREPMAAQWSARGAVDELGLVGEGVYGPMRGTYLVGTSVLPGLGQEGQLLAARRVAELIGKTRRAWQKRRAQMWTKIDTGRVSSTP